MHVLYRKLKSEIKKEEYSKKSQIVNTILIEWSLIRSRLDFYGVQGKKNNDRGTKEFVKFARSCT